MHLPGQRILKLSLWWWLLLFVGVFLAGRGVKQDTSCLPIFWNNLDAVPCLGQLSAYTDIATC